MGQNGETPSALLFSSEELDGHLPNMVPQVFFNMSILVLYTPDGF